MLTWQALEQGAGLLLLIPSQAEHDLEMGFL